MHDSLRPEDGSFFRSLEEHSACNEAELVRAAKSDPDSFGPIYHRYVDSIFGYCYRRLGTREAAEDATSLVFTNALSKLSACNGLSFRAWLFRIAQNVVTDTYRGKRPEQPLEIVLHLVGNQPSPYGILAEATEHDALQALLARLPSDQRRVVDLRLAGLTGIEIARVLNRSHPAVKMLQSRAVKRLRTLLAADEHTEETSDAS